jgi:hypothetical protein
VPAGQEYNASIDVTVDADKEWSAVGRYGHMVTPGSDSGGNQVDVPAVDVPSPSTSVTPQENFIKNPGSSRSVRVFMKCDHT